MKPLTMSEERWEWFRQAAAPYSGKDLRRAEVQELFREALALRADSDSVDAAVTNEQCRWQERFNFLHHEYGVDGGGCDSCDPLDFTESEVRASLTKLEDERDALRTKLAEVEEQLGVVTLNDDMASGIFAELHEVLNAQPCPCGSKDHTSTPPMMYREWLLSVLAGWDLALAASQARERELREAGETALKAMQAIAEREGDALLLGTSFDDACAVQDKLSAALARPTDDSALRGLCERVGEVFRARLLAIAQERSEVASRGDEGAAYEADWLRAVAERIQSASIVNEVLGEAPSRPDGPGAAPIAAEIKEKE